jgi:FtsH-binding integral membrane protein
MDSRLILNETNAPTQSFISKVYMWMCVGLGITGALAAYVSTNQAIMLSLLSNRLFFYAIIICQFGLVIGLTAGINRMTVGAATLAFLFYAAFSGITLSTIFLVYTTSSIASTFFITAGTFGAMSLYGFVTKKDLTSLGNLCFMALIGLILASIVNIFFHNAMLMWIITYAGILIFVGLTAYDTQKIKNMAASSMDEESYAKGAILGALALYLDFINLFIMILRLTGRRR